MFNFPPGFPIRFPKLFSRKDRDVAPPHSIQAGISRVNATVLATASGNAISAAATTMLAPTSTSNNDSFLGQADQIVRFGLNVTSPVAGAIPVAGGPLKAAIGGLLVVLNTIDKRGQNKKYVAELIRRLYSLEATIASLPPATGLAQLRREKLVRDLNAVSEYLKGLPVASLFRSEDVAELIRCCIRAIDEHERDFMVLSSMRMEAHMQGFPELINKLRQLPTFVKQDIVHVEDATGRRYSVLIDQCRSREQFMRVLEAYYYEDKEKDRVMRYYIQRGEYDIYMQSEIGPSQVVEWSSIPAEARIIVSIRKEDLRKRIGYECPRCKTWNDSMDPLNGWIDW